MVDRDIVLGIDIGGTNTKYGYVDRQGRCLADDVMPTRSEDPPPLFFRRLHAQAEGLRGRLTPDHRLVGVGIGAPNANYYKGTIEHPPNLSWTWVDLRAELAPYYRIPIAATNDANAAALGEMFFGAAKEMREFIVITLGTGLGSGIVVNGELVYGSTGFAGEIGHTIVDPAGRPCGCGRRGCLEVYASATGLRLTVLELLAQGRTATPLRDHDVQGLTAKRIFEAALEGDPVALEAFERTGELLGRKLADAVAYTSPEAIFLFGGLAASGELLLGPTRRALEGNLLNIYEGTVKLLSSGIPEGLAAILGASALIWKELSLRRA
jgi:glucokinase